MPAYNFYRKLSERHLTDRTLNDHREGCGWQFWRHLAQSVQVGSSMPCLGRTTCPGTIYSAANAPKSTS